MKSEAWPLLPSRTFHLVLGAGQGGWDWSWTDKCPELALFVFSSCGHPEVNPASPSPSLCVAGPMATAARRTEPCAEGPSLGWETEPETGKDAHLLGPVKVWPGQNKGLPGRAGTRRDGVRV